MSFGENFLLMDTLPNTRRKKVEKAADNNSDSQNMVFYIENIKHLEDWRVYMTGTARNSSFDGSGG